MEDRCKIMAFFNGADNIDEKSIRRHIRRESLEPLVYAYAAIFESTHLKNVLSS